MKPTISCFSIVHGCVFTQSVRVCICVCVCVCGFFFNNFVLDCINQVCIIWHYYERISIQQLVLTHFSHISILLHLHYLRAGLGPYDQIPADVRFNEIQCCFPKPQKVQSANWFERKQVWMYYTATQMTRLMSTQWSSDCSWMETVTKPI